MLVLLTVLAKVEAVTGQSPSLPVMKAEHKPLALTADALKLDHNQAEAEAEAEADIVKPATQRAEADIVRPATQHVEPVRILPAFHVLTVTIISASFACQKRRNVLCYYHTV